MILNKRATTRLIMEVTIIAIITLVVIIVVWLIVSGAGAQAQSIGQKIQSWFFGIK